jgi:hypothetical protein
MPTLQENSAEQFVVGPEEVPADIKQTSAYQVLEQYLQDKSLSAQQ